MKKIYFLALSLLVTGSVLGQNTAIQPSGKVIDQKQISKFNLHQITNSTKANNRWYNYGDAIDVLLGNVGEYDGNYIFPDSTISVVYTGGVLGGTWIHKLGDVLDPTVIAFNDPTFFPGELALVRSSTYTLDSIQFYGFYYRGYKTPTAVDTLIFDVAIIDVPGAYSYFGPGAISTNLGTDTTKFVDVLYTQPTNTLGMNPHTTYKVPLTVATVNDTLPNGINVINAAPGITVAANKIVVLSVSFKPGYSWTFMDSITSYNRLRFLTIDENPGQFPTYTKGDWNVSYILPQDVRYNLAGGWNGSYIPSFAYMGDATNTYSYIHHAINYKCTGLTNYGSVSVQENESAANILGNAYPNPVNVNSGLIIPINTNDSHASLSVTNIFGQEIMSFNTINNGQVLVNTSNLNAGMYFYTLQSGKNITTKRFTVIK